MRRSTGKIKAALLAPLLFWGTMTSAQFGGTAGYDESLDAITPSEAALSLGLAGDSPAHIARYLMARGAGTARLSPDGSLVAFSYDVTGENQLWIVSVSGGQPHQLTFGNGISFFRWTPDGSAILYGADDDGNEREAYYLIDAGGLSERKVLPATDNGFRSFGDFAANDTFFYASTERNGLDYDIWMSDLNGNARLVFEGSYAFRPASVSPDGNYVIVTESVGEDGDNVYLMNVETAELMTVSAPEPRANHADAGFTWTRNSASFYFATNVDREFTQLARYDLETGKISFVEGSSDPGHDVGNVKLCHRDRLLVWTENHDGFYRLRAMDTSSAEMLSVPQLAEGTIGFDCTAEQRQLLVRVNSWQRPAELLTWNFKDQSIKTVFSANLAGIDPDTIVRPSSIRLRARDGVALQGLLYLPRGKPPAGGFPVLFDVHGGPTSQSVAGFEPVAQYHVQQGIAVFQPNVRGSTGFGRTYTQLDDQEKRLDSIRDLVDMLTHFEADPMINAGRAAVMGGSYGGYAVNAVLAAFPGHFIAGVSLYGVADWVTALEVASPALKASDRIEYGDIREAKWREFYTAESPIRQADQINVPVLYSHGVKDPRIDIAETETMVRALRKNGVPAPYIRIPDEGHGWRKLSNQIFYYQKEAEFLKQHLQPESAD